MKAEKLQSNAGYSLPEAIVTLLIIGIISCGVLTFGIKISDIIAEKNFDKECQTILEAIHSLQTESLMGQTDGSYFVIYSDGIEIKTYTDQFTLDSQFIDFTYATAKNYRKKNGVKIRFVGKPIHFTSAGTISRGASYMLTDNRNHVQYLVLQPVTGRIYLTHEKPAY